MNEPEIQQATDVPVAIVGAGPVGLALATGLARHGVRSLVIERDEATSEYSKAPVLHVRTREILRRWGIEPRFRQRGILRPTVALEPVDGSGPLLNLDFGELNDEADEPGLLVLEQSHTERLLLEAATQSGHAEVRFSTEALELRQTADEALLTVANGGRREQVSARYIVGCDGAGSFVRQALGLGFEGLTYSLRPMLADVRISREPDNWVQALSWHNGYSFAVQLEPGLWRLVHLEAAEPEAGDGVPDDEVIRIAKRLLNQAPEVIWASRFRIHLRSAPRFRVGRVLLAGDAAHVHSPAGGQGMNAGIGDADNLAWKLAAALDGGDAAALLDSYDIERRAVVVGNVSRYTDLITRLFLQSGEAVRDGAFALLRNALSVSGMRRDMLRRTALIDLGYPDSPVLDASRPPAGQRLPNPVLETSAGAQARLYDLLPRGHFMIDVAHSRPFVPDLPLPMVVRVGPQGMRDPAGVLRRLLGGRDGLLLVRPDSYIGWAGTNPGGLAEALARSTAGANAT